MSIRHVKLIHPLVQTQVNSCYIYFKFNITSSRLPLTKLRMFILCLHSSPPCLILCLHSSPPCQNIGIRLRGIVAQPSDMKMLKHAQSLEAQPDLIAIDERTQQIRKVSLLTAVAVSYIRSDQVNRTKTSGAVIRAIHARDQ
jgi:hypothetical protein